jgi:hypothetical protein
MHSDKSFTLYGKLFMCGYICCMYMLFQNASGIDGRISLRVVCLKESKPASKQGPLFSTAHTNYEISESKVQRRAGHVFSIMVRHDIVFVSLYSSISWNARARHGISRANFRRRLKTSNYLGLRHTKSPPPVIKERMPIRDSACDGREHNGPWTNFFSGDTRLQRFTASGLQFSPHNWRRLLIRETMETFTSGLSVSTS